MRLRCNRCLTSWPLSLKDLCIGIAPTPLLMVVPEQDTTVETKAQFDMYRLALEPKQIHLVKNCGHFGIYGSGVGFDENIRVQIEFLRNLEEKDPFLCEYINKKIGICRPEREVLENVKVVSCLASPSPHIS